MDPESDSDAARRAGMDVLFFMSVVSLPIGLLMFWLGYTDDAVDFEAGVFWLLFGLVPPVWFAICKYRHKRGRDRGSSDDDA